MSLVMTCKMRKLRERRSQFSLTEKQMKVWLFCCNLGVNKPACPAHDTHPARPVGVCCTPSSAGLWILYTGHSGVNYPSSKLSSCKSLTNMDLENHRNVNIFNTVYLVSHRWFCVGDAFSLSLERRHQKTLLLWFVL